ncbi:MAG: gliding motility-associated C-terminal domain-containing protein [Bacteroidales bacterium]
MKRTFFLSAILILTLGLNAQVMKPFNIAFQKTQRGGITYLANSGLKFYSKDSTAMPPDAGVSNGSLYSQYIDIDNDPSTFMSSSDSLNLLDCSDISYAYLVWAGAASKNNPRLADINKVKIRSNNGSYINLIADEIVDSTNTNLFGGSYYCFKNVTNIIKTAGPKVRWTVANIVAQSTPPNLVGSTPDWNKFSGWGLVIVYKNESENLRQLTLYKGLSLILIGKPPILLPFEGFKTPNQGPVTFEFGHISWDGDRDYKGDSLSIKSLKNGNYQFISDNTNSIDNIFNSTISNKGVLTPFRKPSYNNNFCIDADIFSPDNATRKYIGWGENSLSLKLTTGNEGYLTQVVSLAIDANIPDDRLGMKVKDLNGGVVQPGDTLEYTLLGCNVGTDKSELSYITNKIDGNAHFVPGSIRIVSGPNAGVKTDAIGDDQADYDSATKTVKVRIGQGANGTSGGEIVQSLTGADSTVVKFRVTATDDCMQLKCDNVIDNHALITGFGNDSGLKFESDQVPQYYDGKTCTISDISNQSSIIIFSDCTIPPLTTNGPICSTQDLKLTAPSNANASYKWSGPNSFTSTEQNPIIKSAPAVASGKYTCTISVKYTTTDSLKETTCSKDYTVNAVVNATIRSSAGPDQSICSLTTKLQGVAPVSGQGTWSEVTNASGVSIVNVNLPTTKVTFATPGEYKFKWLIPDTDPLHCVVTSDTVGISVGKDCPPILDNEFHTIKKDSTATGDLTDIGDISGDGKPLITDPNPLVNPKHGGVIINTDGTYTYTPTVGYIGKDTVVVNICDQQLPQKCAKDTIFITVIPYAPLVVVNDSKTVDDCAVVSGNLTTNDTSLGNKFVLTAAKYNTKYGKIDFTANGAYIYTANCGFTTIKRDTIIVNICDTQTPKQCKNDTLFITITPTNSVPVAVDDKKNETTGKLDDNDVQSQDGPNVWSKLSNPINDKGEPTGTVVVEPDGRFTYTPPTPDFVGTVTFTYQITDGNGDKSQATVTLNVQPIWIPEGYSPNGDGNHDKFVITNFDKTRYPDNTINIFNRWGNKVYVAHPYDNEWDGTNNQGLSVGGNVLPVGTYFYILDLGTGLKPFRGYVYLSR